MVYANTPSIVKNAIEFALRIYQALYAVYDNVIYVINEPLRDVMPDIGILDDIFIDILDIFNIWGGADISILELCVGALLPNIVIVIVCRWLWTQVRGFIF